MLNQHLRQNFENFEIVQSQIEEFFVEAWTVSGASLPAKYGDNIDKSLWSVQFNNFPAESCCWAIYETSVLTINLDFS